MPGGRPSKLDQVVAERDGQPITAGQMVIERVRATWAPWEAAAGSAGVTRSTLSNWRKEGAQARGKAALGMKLTKHEHRCAQFLDDLEKAEEEAHLRALGTVQREAQGGYVITRTVTKVVGGKEIEKVVTEETARPIWQAGAWLLERRRRDVYARRYELTGAQGEPLVPKEDRADALAEALESFQAGVDAQAARAAEASSDKATKGTP